MFPPTRTPGRTPLAEPWLYNHNGSKILKLVISFELVKMEINVFFWSIKHFNELNFSGGGAWWYNIINNAAGAVIPNIIDIYSSFMKEN